MRYLLNIIQRILILSLVSLLLTYGCKKDDINDQKVDWRLSEHRKLFDTTEYVSLNHHLNFAFLNDSTFFLYGRNSVTGFYKNYLIQSDSLVDLTETFHGLFTEICQTDENIFFKVGNNVYRSDRSLKNLELITSDETGLFTKVNFLTKDTGIILKSNVGYYNEFIITFNGGASWQSALIDSSQSATNYFYNFAFIENNKRTCLISSNDKVFISRDGGIHWKYYFTTGFKITNIYFIDDLEGYIISENKIFKTTDAGKTFNQILDFSYYIDKVQVRDDEIFFLSNWILYYSDNEFADYRNMILENPFPENMDRCVINFEIRDNRSFVVDNVGNIYFRDN